MRNTRLVPMIAILVIALVGSGCDLTGLMSTQVTNMVLQAAISKNPGRVMDYYFPAHLAIVCGVITWAGILRSGSAEAEGAARAKLPKKIRVQLQTFPPNGGGETFEYTMKVKKGVFSGSFDTPTGTLLGNNGRIGTPPAGSPPEECPANYDIQPGTFLGLNLSALNGSMEIGDLFTMFVAVRPIVELDECTPQVIPTGKSVRRTQWIRRPGKSTVKPFANSGGFGVEVHCQSVNDGDQGTIRVYYDDGTREIIGITCNS